MTRVYVRKFDHDEARARHAAGETTTALAAEYGVSWNAVWCAVNPDADGRRAAANLRWRTGECETCGGPAMRLVGAKKKNNPDGRVLCKKCRDVERRTTVRDTELRCVTCGAWGPDSAFPSNRDEPQRRGRHGTCRKCQTAVKRAYREKTRVPCSHGCGTMVNSADRTYRDKPFECLPCALRRIGAERKASA